MGRRLNPSDCTVAACPLTVTEKAESAGATNAPPELTRFQFVTVVGSGPFEFIARTSNSVGDKIRSALSPILGILRDISLIIVPEILVFGALLVFDGAVFVFPVEPPVPDIVTNALPEEPTT